MSKRRLKPSTGNAITQAKVDVFLRVPSVLHAWLREEAEAGGLKNVQEKILDVIRQARDAAVARAA